MAKITPHCLPITFTPCKLRRPTKDGSYLCYTHNGYITTLSYIKKFDLFNVHIELDGTCNTSTAIYPLAWAEFDSIDRTLIAYKEDDTDGKW